MPDPRPETPGGAGAHEHVSDAVPAATFIEQFGGIRGLIDGSLPGFVFVLVRIATSSLNIALIAALALGAGLLVLRRLRGEPLQQVGAGFVGVLLAVLVARVTGSGEGYFLPGIITTALTGVGFVVSLVVHRPAVGLALAAYDRKYAGYREHDRLRRAVTWATAVWAVTFFIRAGVAAYVYSLPGDSDGLLLIVINAVKWPLMAGAALLTVLLVRRSGYSDDLVELDQASTKA